MTTTAASSTAAEARPSAPSHSYHPAIDGLRAVAVAAVVLYHGEGSPLPGGFLGVDTFFVISGFLITSLLVQEWVGTGGIDLRAFWGRRVRRLFPALVVLLVAVAVYALVAAPDVTRRSLRWDGLATLGYVANWRLIFSHQSYFEQLAGASPLRHAWSLAVEEQWYLLWPIVAALALRRWGRRPRLLLAGVAALALASTVEMAWLVRGAGDTSRAYYGTDTRAQALLVGAGLALVLRRWPLPADRSPGPRAALVRALGLVGLVVGIGLFVLVDDRQRWMYRGGFLLCALAWAAVVAACLRGAGGPVGGLLARRPLVALGRISYGVYLWHWPVIVVATRARTGWSGWPLLGLQIALTVGLAAASFVLVEQPVRTGGWRRVWRWRPGLAVAATAGLVVIALLAATVGAPAPPPARAVGGDAVAPRGAGSEAPISVPERLDPPGLPPPSDPPGAAPAPVPAGRPVRTMVLGDSVGFDVVFGAPPVAGIQLLTRAIPGCGVLPVDVQVADQRLLPSDQCPRWLDEWRLAAHEQPDVALVFLGAWEVFDPYVDGVRLAVGSPPWERYVEGQLEQGVDVLADGTTTRIGLATVPCFATSEPVLGIPSDERAQRRRTQAVDRVVRTVAARHPGRVALVDWAGFVCPGGRDRRTIDGVVVRPDGMHPDAPADRVVWTWLAPIVLAMAHRPVL